MKTKHLLMTLLLALFVPWAAQAQLTMTVCEGDKTNAVIPLNGYSTDTPGTCGEFIIPASLLSDMVGGTISQIQFYPQSGYNWSPTFYVYLKEVDYTTLSGTLGPNACTIVYTGTLDASGTTMDIPFDDNYLYEGGNLLIGTYLYSGSDYQGDAYFLGIEAEGAAYASGTYNGSRDGSYDFIPQTTFTYTPGANYCAKPANVHIVENTLGPREVAIEWDAESGELFEESMQATSSFDPNNIHWSDATTSHYEEWDRLTPDTDYTFCVRKKCGTDSYSQPVFLEFRTPVACPAPTLALVANSETARGATLNWTGFSDSYILQMGSIASSETVTLLSESFDDSSMPTGWSIMGLGTSNWSISNTSNAGGEAYELMLNWSSQFNGISRVVFPAMDLTGIESVTVSFKHYLNNYSGSSEIGIATSSDGGTTWNTGWSKSYSSTGSESINNKTITTPDMGQDNVLFCLYYSGSSYNINQWYFDDIEITAEVSTYEWITFDNNATSPYTFNTLLPETTYNVRVIGNCGSDGNSQPSNMVSFTTLASCPVPTALNVPETTITAHEATLLWTADNDSYNIRYQVVNSTIEGFEGGTLPEGWIVNKTSSSTGVNSQAAHEGSYGFQFYYSEQNASLISPLLSGTENGVDISFYYKESTNQYGDEQFQVGYTTDASVTDAAAFTYGDVITASLSWQLYENSFPAGTKRVAIKYIYNDALYLFIDDITFAIADENWSTATSNTTTYNFRSLAPETTYTAQVQGVCGSETTNWSEAISFTTTIACPAPTNLVYDNVTKNSVELSWTETGGATEWEICINGDEENLVGVMENPYTLDRLDPQTDYTVKVRAVCGGEDGESQWSNTISFTTVVACPAPTNLVASNATYNSVELSWTESGEATEWELCVNGDTENLIGVTENPYTLNRLDPDTEYTVKVRAVCGGDDGESQWSNTVSFTTAEACAKPTNLAETNITTNSATLSWNGTSEQYVLQYRPWTQVGEDHLSTEEFVTYTYDLSEFKGQGSIAIRHYDVTDVFYLNVDNVELKADDESTIFFEDFESGSIPSTWTNYDVDGDGYTWDMAQTGSMNVIGNYGVYSASWLSGVGALTPDNWLIISNVELGGTFSFAARGQDPNFPAENFAVYVSMESDITEVAVNGTSYNAENLTPATPYAWQVKGDCGEYQSNWVTSLFKTKDDAYIFATDGDWDDLANWTDAEGNPISELPTVERKVRVNAEAIIPAGVVATAGKTTINGGSITVKDGGELKHNTATLWVTMEKDITAWTIGETIDENNKSNGWYFISTPFSGTTEIEASGAWSHVNNLAADGYDLYGFDPTADQEWINYEADSLHAVFTAGNNHGLVFKRGYLYASDTDRTVTFTGTISKSVNNSMTETFDYDGTSTDRFNGWALVGNPFSCSAYINYVDGETVLDADYYVMNADGNGYELSQSSVALAPLTGAFINYSATGTVQFSTENNRAAQSGLLNMTVSQGRGNIDQARLRFGRGYNLKHMSFRNNSSKLYMPVEGNDYAVVYAEGNGEMPVNFKAERNGTYTLGFNTENVEFSYLHLIDNLTGNDVDLLANSSYSFEAQTTDYASRFKLVFATGSNDDNFAFFNNGNIIVNNEGEATLQVMDVNGRIIRSESINGTASIKMNAAAGVYMLRLINGNDVKVQKMIVK